MSRMCGLIFIIGLLIAPITELCAVDAPYVAGADRILSETKGDALVAAGELLLGELNCVSCHATSERTPSQISAKTAPILTGATSRLQPDYVRRMLIDPAAMKPGTTMPHLLHGLSEVEIRERAESLLHYLVSIGGLPQQELPMIGTGEHGSTLFHRVGCAACHGSPEDRTTQANATPLGDVAAKYTLPGLTQFLLDPLHVRPGGRMPSLNLNQEEARAIAASLLHLPEVARLKFAYYEGDWSRVPDFDALTPKLSGGAEAIGIEAAERRDHFGLRFDGYLRIEQAGVYRFYLGSDDGSLLRIDDRVVIENNDVHPYTEKSADIELDAGTHAIRIDYFEQAGDERLTAEFEGPDVARQPLDAWMTAEESTATLDTAALTVQLDSARVAQGRELFVTAGCAACHEVKEGEARVASRMQTTPALSQLHVERGCLAEQPPLGVPRYELSDSQRQAMIAAIQQIENRREFSPGERIHRTLAQFQCYGCHERNGVGGVTESRNAFFQTTIPEMGDEGRLPPPLNGAGGKLKSDYFAKILAEGSKDRPYMLTRMPRFGAENVGHLVGLLESEDAVTELPEIRFHESAADVKEAGRVMVGEQGFACIKCHTFGRFPAQGIQAINLQLMSSRLRKEWFRRYMRNPQEFRPGTRMPAAWPPSGKSLLDQFFAGEVEPQIEAIWLYLSDADRARIPSGLIIPSMELVPVDNAIIYRNFIEGAGPRAIGVGYPESIHQAFDANDMRIALLWQGRFIDASRHWTGRGEGFQPPAGEKVLQLASGPPLAFLPDAQQPWPTEGARQLGYRFRGYHLSSDQRPTFRYTYGNITVEDFLNTQSLGQGDAVPRVLTLSSDKPVDGLWFRAAVGRIQEVGDGWYTIDDQWRMQIESPEKPVVRASNGRDELLVPVKFTDGKSQIIQKFQW